MSWFAKSFVNSLIADEDDDDPNPNKSPPSDQDPSSPSRGIQEDLNELSKTLSRQFWGVANFLAPPPSSATSSSSADVADEPTRVVGFKNDLAEIGGRFRSGIEKLSQTKAVSEISKMAGSLLAFELDGEEVVVGINEEVLMFVNSISVYPRTWLDFPKLNDSDDFDMSDAQNEHALAIERLAPDLAKLRSELCPSQMSEECFWKIYFVLLHPRLNKHEAELLSTPQILEARAMLLQDIQSQKKTSKTPQTEVSSLKEESRDAPVEGDSRAPLDMVDEVQPSKRLSSGTSISDISAEIETEKHPVQTVEVEIVDKSIIQEQPATQVKIKDLYNEPSKISTQPDEEDGDDWLEDDTIEAASTINTAHPLGLEEDVSFSDLEDDDNGHNSSTNLNIVHKSESETDDSKDWVQLNKTAGISNKGHNSSSSQSKGSNDWLDIEDIDAE